MTQETARETAESVREVLADHVDHNDEERVEAMHALADGDRDPSELDWEDWTYPLKVVDAVILQLDIHGQPVKWYDVRKADLLHVHHGGSSGWRQVLPGHLRGGISRTVRSSGAGYDVTLRPVLRSETPTGSGEP